MYRILICRYPFHLLSNLLGIVITANLMASCACVGSVQSSGDIHACVSGYLAFYYMHHPGSLASHFISSSRQPENVQWQELVQQMAGLV